jgi:DNA-binding CsgD family transcriptional regulator/predicted negative regulator of RcsB-dependent stress response
VDPGTVQQELLEREAELEAIIGAAERAAGGEGALVVIEAAAGMGKTRLLEAGCHAADERGVELLRARGGELERDFAYGVVRQLLERRLLGSSAAERDALLKGAAELAGPAIGVDPQPQAGASTDLSFSVAHGLYWLVSNMTARAPVIISVDDAHWADAPTLRFLLYLVARLEGLPLLVLVAARPGEPGTDTELLHRIAGAPGARVLKPGALSTDAVGELALRRLGAPSAPDFVQNAHRATGGNPFLLHELLGALEADGFTADAEAAERVTRLGPETVSRSLLLRLVRLPESCARLARAVAVLGARADPAHAAALAGIDGECVGEAADALAAVEILSPGRPLTFVHPVVREAIYGDLPPAERAAMHASAARVLFEASANPDELVPHLLAAEPSGSPAVVEALRGAAQRALDTGAANLAQRYLRRAVTEPPDPEIKPDLLAELGMTEFLVGEEHLAAVGHLQEALEATTDPTTRAERVLALGRVLFATGEVRAAYDAIESEVDSLDGADAEAITRLEAELGSLGVLDPRMGRRASRRATRFAEVEGSTPAELVLLSNLAHWEWFGGSAARAAELAERSLGGGRLLAAHGGDSIVVYQSAWVLAYADEHGLAMELLEGALADARARGSAYAFTASSSMRAMVALRGGDLRSAEAEARNGIAIEPPPPHPASRCNLTLALVGRGALEEAEAELEACAWGPELPALVFINPVFYARGRLRLAQGRPREALEDFTELGRRDEQLGVRNPGVPWRCGAAEAHLRLGDREEATRLADEHAELAKRWGTRSAIGVAQHILGLVAGDDGLALLADAVATLADSPARLDHARALVDLGAATRRAGHRAEAREPLRMGLEAARRCGASALAEFAHAELVTAGARPRRLMFSGAESLTASERRVAEMAAAGQRNREVAQALFVTQKTVENHLGHVYSKLGIVSRSELGAALADSGGSRP